ncbi:hypothetical protein VT98_11913 [Candidatus Electrothrix communis]|jgi:hypothetical protein|uniref:Uncharacterized protein n=1 Tax=Candidatus Electrothrix communis TaxID=1859133 RepID=A0A444J4I0_9BACT|nr:hypothetical protein VT98_11913 [Candidatus Electrothrix communis]
MDKSDGKRAVDVTEAPGRERINLPDAGKKDKRNLSRWMLRLKK